MQNKLTNTYRIQVSPEFSFGSINTGGFSAGSGKTVPRRDDPGNEPMLPDVGVAMQGVDFELVTTSPGICHKLKKV